MKLLIIQPLTMRKYESLDQLEKEFKRQIEENGFLILDKTRYDYSVEEVDVLKVKE